MINQIEPYIEEKDVNAVTEYLRSGGWLTEHNITEQFEKSISNFVGAKYCSLVPSGTVGLILSLMASGIGKGMRVGVPVLTMIATVNAIISVGAEPVYLDANYVIPDNVNAVIHVSLNGRSMLIDRVVKECEKRGILLIEDSCQSFGSSYIGKQLGTFGNVGVYSFSPHKIITTGQGGAIITNDKTIHRNIELLKDFGREQNGIDFHPYFGVNAKFTDLQSSIGLSQLKSIGERVHKKRYIYGKYYCNLPEIMYSLDEGETPWFVTVCVDNPESLAEYLFSYGIMTRPMYPLVTSQPIYKRYEKYPISEKISKTRLWLPSSLNLKDDEIDYVSDKVITWLKEKR